MSVPEVLRLDALEFRPEPTAQPASAAALVEWVRLAGTGDQRAFSALYDVTVRSSFLLAIALVGESLAEQVCHDAYLEAWRTAPLYDATHSPQAWVGLIVQRHAREHLRRSGLPAPELRSQGSLSVASL